MFGNVNKSVQSKALVNSRKRIWLGEQNDFV